MATFGSVVSPELCVHDIVNINVILRYGQPRVSLPRKVIPRGMFSEPSLELFPPQIKVHLLSRQPISDDQSALNVTISIKDTLHDLYDQILRALPPSNTSNPPQRRIWRLTEGGNYLHRHFPSARLKENGASPLEDDSSKFVENMMIEPGDTFVIEEQESDGQWLIEGMPKSAVPSGTTTPLSNTASTSAPKLFDSTTNYFDKFASPTRKRDEPPTSLRPPATIKITPSTVVKPKAASIVPGTLGLGNM